jgi:Peptide N-acetyl-beta-D-glucosaminyl asparaginase amidase A
MRRALVGAAIVVVALLAVPAGLPGAAPHAAPSRVHPALATAPLAALPNGRALLRGLFSHNATVPGASTPVSGYQDTAPPPLPDTTPTVVPIVTNGRGCCDYVNETPAGGPWDAVVLNYTGTVVNGVYDSSYRASVDGAQVLFGTTPEYGTWTVLDNLTEYESLLEPGANFTFILSAAVLSGGYFETSLSLSFYPAPAGGPLPSEPTEILPLWDEYIKPTQPIVSANATVPRNASAAALELWTYGYGPNGGDEFWWASQTPQRAVDVSLDGTPFAAIYPFPYVNTGGIDLFLWRPIPAAFTLSDRRYEVNVSGALGDIEGRHTYNASINGRNLTDDWYVAGALLLWTNGSVMGATEAPGSSQATFPVASGSNTVTSSTSFAYNSTLTTSAGPVSVSSDGTSAFREATTTAVATGNGTTWQNITQTSSFSDRTVSRGANGTTYANSSRAFGFGTDLGVSESISTASGSYPLYGNVTSSMLSFDQDWTEATAVQTVAPTGRTATFDDLDNEVLGANGIFDQEVEVPTMGAASEVVAYPLIESATPTYTAESTSGAGGYSHVMAGSDFDPTNVDLAETLLQNQFDTVPVPLSVGASASLDPVDQGHGTLLLAVARGGVGVDRYAWSDLPAGCVSANSSLLSCTPSSPGTYAPTVTVSDSEGDVATSTPAVLVVEPPLLASVVASGVGADLGGSLSFSADVSGGSPPYACAWTINGVPALGGCTGPIAAGTEVPGPVNASVSVTDSTGVTLNASSASVTVNGPLLLHVSASNTSVVAGMVAGFSLSIQGGTPPFVITWLEGTSPLLGRNGSTLTLVPTSPGTLNVSVRVDDAAGVSVTSNIATTSVVSASGSPTSNGTGGSSSDLNTPLFWAAVALAAVAGIEAVLLVAKSLPPPRR